MAKNNLVGKTSLTKFDKINENKTKDLTKCLYILQVNILYIYTPKYKNCMTVLSTL